MDHVENNETLLMLLEHLLEARSQGWLSSEGLVACLRRELTPTDDDPTTALQNRARDPHLGVELQQTTTLRIKPAEMLARKINILLDTIMTDSGKRFEYLDVRDCAKEAGYYISRTRWELLKAGKEQVVPEECLHALAAVFGVDPDYLVQEDGELPEQVRTEMGRLRRLRIDEVRDYASRSLKLVDPEALRAITATLSEVS